MVPARRFLAELFAPHEKGSQQQAGSFASDVASGLGSQNIYDPDRARFQQELAAQMNGPGAEAGLGATGPYGTNPGQNPYTPGPDMNANLGTFGPGGQPGTVSSSPVVGPATPPPAGNKAGAAGQPGTAGAQSPNRNAMGIGPAGGDPMDPNGTNPLEVNTPPQTIPTTPGATNTTSGYQPPAGGLAGQRDAAGSGVLTGLSAMLADPNIPQATKDAIQQQSALTAKAGFAGANEQINRNAAATGNSGGTAAALAQTGRAQAGTMADLNRQNNLAFEQEKERRKETALTGLSNYYGQASSNYNTIAGMRGGIAAAPVGTQTGARNLTKGIQTGNTNTTNVNWV